MIEFDRELPIMESMKLKDGTIVQTFEYENEDGQHEVRVNILPPLPSKMDLPMMFGTNGPDRTSCYQAMADGFRKISERLQVMADAEVEADA